MLGEADLVRRTERRRGAAQSRWTIFRGGRTAVVVDEGRAPAVAAALLDLADDQQVVADPLAERDAGREPRRDAGQEGQTVLLGPPATLAKRSIPLWATLWPTPRAAAEHVHCEPVGGVYRGQGRCPQTEAERTRGGRATPRRTRSPGIRLAPSP